MKPTQEKLSEIKDAAQQWAIDRLQDTNTVICDTETTGLPSKDPDTEICQLCLSDIKGRPLFSMLLKPNKPMSDEVIGIHGISNEQVQHQPMFPQIAKMVEFVLKDKHIVCYNASFDVKLLWGLFKKYNQPVPQVSGITCAMEKYSEWKGEWNEKKDSLRWHKLPNLSGMVAHDAYSDCISTIKVMELMAGKHNREEITAESIDLNF